MPSCPDQHAHTALLQPNHAVPLHAPKYMISTDELQSSLELLQEQTPCHACIVS